ncbi:MAG: hypothetical protein IKE03_00185 [Blautia sp.]|nr:hypothetical protein [Blautia sp.]
MRRYKKRKTLLNEADTRLVSGILSRRPLSSPAWRRRRRRLRLLTGLLRHDKQVNAALGALRRVWSGWRK